MTAGKGKRILLITSTQLSLNPRLVKEADTLSDKGYEVTVFYSYWNQWGAEFDNVLLPGKKWKAVLIGGDPEQKPAIFFISRLVHNLALLVNRRSRGKKMADTAIARSAWFLKRAAKKHKADLYIGHNPGALPATVEAANKNRKLCGFDAEDFHRNEMSDNPEHPDVVLKTCLENKYFPKLDYLSTSSPSIASAYKEIFPEIDFSVVLNAFPSIWSITKSSDNTSEPLRLLWFSQTIGIKRGLEDIISALALLKDYPFELHLLGNLPQDTRVNYIDKLVDKNIINVHFHKPIPSDELAGFASKFDIGLALEPAFSNNNNMALSNKIFTYLQGGLAIVASDTKAQGWLLNTYPQIGNTYKKGDPQALADVLLYYHQHRDELFKTRTAAFETARAELNWENESKKFLNIVQRTLLRDE